MPVTYTYVSNAALTKVTPDLMQVASMDDPIFKIFPIRNRNASRLRWTIKDYYTGLMNLRGLGGEPIRVNKVGSKMYEEIPGYYGEFQTIDETEMTTRASGVAGYTDYMPVNVDDLISDSLEQLTFRQVARMRQVSWLLALTGTFSIPLPDGGIGHTGSYTTQTLTVSPLWSSTATAHPLADMRSLQPLYGFGTSNRYNEGAQAYMNSATANYLLNNTLATDLGGKRIENGATINDIDGIKRIFSGQNSPTINIFDDGYIDSSSVFQLFIPTGKVLVVAQRPNGETPGEFQITRNAANPDIGPRPYTYIEDLTRGPMRQIPPKINIHQGFNGGPVVERGTQLLVMTVG